jgi:hypothetical protein
VYRDGLVGPVPAFPDQMEQRITHYVQRDVPALAARPLLSGSATAIAIPPQTSSLKP